MQGATAKPPAKQALENCCFNAKDKGVQRVRIFNPFKPSGNKHEITVQVVRTFATIVYVTQGGFPVAPLTPSEPNC